MRPAVSYTRVSTERQVLEGVSMSAQSSRIKAWAAFNNHEIVGSFEDAGISGSKMKTRPGLLAALDAACKSKATLVVFSLSRLARSTRDALEISDRLNKAGANLASITENLDTTSASGKMIFGILSVLCEFEKNTISERTTMALEHKRKNGEKTGGTLCYGFDSVMSGGKVLLIANKDEEENICYMMHLKTRGYTYGAIAKALNGKGILAKLGGRWSAKTVRDVIMQEKKRRKMEGA